MAPFFASQLATSLAGCTVTSTVAGRLICIHGPYCKYGAWDAVGPQPPGVRLQASTSTIMPGSSAGLPLHRLKRPICAQRTVSVCSLGQCGSHVFRVARVSIRISGRHSQSRLLRNYSSNRVRSEKGGSAAGHAQFFSNHGMWVKSGELVVRSWTPAVTSSVEAIHLDSATAICQY
ncbi:hypothetical protein CC78DRAFT_580121 [Lojkania enalia]|uniref:Uncharacterized protein n=1 Tax=Lojkania enalia TaxID=147567 RepID=A0A9P4K8L1_9PLEO|nr:hypothetical protein CC78DRAFT_580121 [Didymosphaeria enalia]